jgi:hypothetical protein
MAKSWYETVPKDVWGDDPQQDVQATGIAPTTTQKPATGGIGSPQSYYSQGMETLTGLANGTAPIYKSTENRLSQQFGGAALAATGAAKQGAAQAGLSTEGIGSIEQTTLKNLEGERSKLMGDIAAQKQAGASSAANSLVSGGLSGMGQQLSEAQYRDTKKQGDWNRMLEYYDPSTPDGLKALQGAYTEMFGGTAPDMNVLKEQMEYNRTKQQQDVAIGSASVVQAEQQVRDTNLASTMNLVTAGYNVDRINEILGTNYTADEYAKMRENSSTYFQSKGIDMQEATLYGYDLPDGTHIQGSLEISAGQFGLQSKTYEDQRNELYGYTDANGNVITGKYESLSNSEKRAADAMYGYEAKDSKGNTITDSKGNPVRIKGTLELQNSADQIAQQGMTLQQAQIKGYVDENGMFQKGSVQIAAEAAGINVSSAYGYSYNTETGQVVTDPTEIQKLKAEGKLETVDGAIALAGKQFGLQEGSLDLQYQQLFGIDRKGNVVKDSNGDPVKGTMYYMNSEDQRAAYQLYGGMAVDAEGNAILGKDGKQLRVAGTLEIMQDEQLLKERGMSVEEAAVFGYDKKADGKNVHVYGSLEIESEKLDIVRQEAENQKNSEAGVALSSYFGSMKNVTGWNYQNDPQAQKLLQNYWESTGNAGTYDKGWAQNQLVATTISESDAALANLENERWYKDLLTGSAADKKMAEQVKTVASLAAMLSVTQGVVPIYNETGDVVGLNDSEGNQILNLEGEIKSSNPTEEKKLGGIFVEKDRVYEIAAGGKKTELTYGSGGEWTAEADKIIEIGSDGNPYYEKIMAERSKQIRDGTHEVGRTIEDKALYKRVLSDTSKYNFITNADLQSTATDSLISISNPPPVGDIVNFNGVLYRVESGVKTGFDNRYGRYQYLNSVELSTGKTANLQATLDPNTRKSLMSVSY